ncbi:unnamed protein product [Symbiodinium sp. CCMP2592]|nr:unnamed protein product [Symbiodinium sp. CCMP2592]
MDEILREGQELAPPSREETKYFASMFPKPHSPTPSLEPTAPMDTREQPKRGILEDSSVKEEGQQKAHKAAEKATPKAEPAPTISTTATPTGSQSSQTQQSLHAAPSTAINDSQSKGKNKGKKDKNKGKGKGQKNGSNGYIFFLRTAGPESIIPPLARVSQAWNLAKETEIPRYPLRIVLLSALLEATIERAEAAVTPEKKGGNSTGGTCDRQRRRVVLAIHPVESRTAHGRGDLHGPGTAIGTFATTEETESPAGLHHAGHHKIAEQLETEVYRLVLEVETVGEEAQNIHEWLRLLANCTVWKLIGGRFRRERLGRYWGSETKC